MPKLPVREILTHAVDLADQRPGPYQLYQRWEAQNWNAEDISFDEDVHHWHNVLPQQGRDALSEMLYSFVLGEYTAVDLLAPILTASPDEHSSLYLGTQLVDEVRHSYVMFRLGRDLLGLPEDPRSILAAAWQNTTPDQHKVHDLEGELVKEIVAHPTDYARWLRGVAMFHLIQEGVLAVAGQRAIVTMLGEMSVMPGTKTAFTAFTRDESRHITYGLHALRQGVLEGYSNEICEVVEKAAPLGMRAMFGYPDNQGYDQLALRNLQRCLRNIGIEEKFIDHVLKLSTAAIGPQIPAQVG
ncbi:ribonucleotide reductase beta subunit family protein with ferritin-like domain [Crossiella equi]|uniref:Ribonucleotide reductase beta subunit family protein with ferritin-like domain n=2 Tax=Crossiella equi TaxID=130796 RepID=A0ABS5AD95_9PSEU|nr:ribonucleotide-diphosphate reductase subunit beta [Crossiella equi]MBP2473680.1 ribonucleotide reductase beta subunit family protein with ferritin-like domain [Crossiella equi]